MTTTPKPTPAPEPKCYHCETCRNQCSPKTGQPICCNCKRELAAPEPQGSEEPIDWGHLDDTQRAAALQRYASLWLDGALGDDHRELCSAYLTLRAEVEALRAELAAIKAQAEDATEYVLAVENRELRAEIARMKRVDSERGGAWEEVNVQDARIDELRVELAESIREHEMSLVALSSVIKHRDQVERENRLLRGALSVDDEPLPDTAPGQCQKCGHVDAILAARAKEGEKR